MPDLVDWIEPLDKNLGAVPRICGCKMPTTPAEHVAEGEPIFFDQDFEAFDRTEVGVEH